IPRLQSLRHVAMPIDVHRDGPEKLPLRVTHWHEKSRDSRFRVHARAAPAGRPNGGVSCRGRPLRKTVVAIKNVVFDLSPGLPDRLVNLEPGHDAHGAGGGPDADALDRAPAGDELVHQRYDRAEPDVVRASLRISRGVGAQESDVVVFRLSAPDMT